MQEARERLHREAARRIVQNARCAVCHRAIHPEVYVINMRRRTRTCLDCAERADPGGAHA